MTGSVRSACTIRPGTVIDVGGRRRMVENTRTDFSSPGTPRVVLKFRDGGPPLRVHLGAPLTVVRPA